MKFRTSNHHLPVETGRWYNTPLNKECVNCVILVKLLTNFIIFWNVKNYWHLDVNILMKNTGQRQILLSFVNLCLVQMLQTWKNYVILLSKYTVWYNSLSSIIILFPIFIVYIVYLCLFTIYLLLIYSFIQCVIKLIPYHMFILLKIINCINN